MKKYIFSPVGIALIILILLVIGTFILSLRDRDSYSSDTATTTPQTQESGGATSTPIVSSGNALIDGIVKFGYDRGLVASCCEPKAAAQSADYNKVWATLITGYDADKDGTLSRTELGAALSDMGLPLADRLLVYANLGPKLNDGISESEYDQLVKDLFAKYLPGTYPHM